MPEYQMRSSKAGQPRSEWAEGVPTEKLAHLLMTYPDSTISFETSDRVMQWRLKPRDQKLIDEMTAQLHRFSSSSPSEQAEYLYETLREQGLVP